MSLRRRWRNMKERVLPRRRIERAPGDMLPARLPSRNLVFVEDEGELWSVGMRCPCGCGETIEMLLMPEANPRWSLSIDKGRYPSLSPSVWRKVGCRAHFWLAKGRVRWCE